MVKWDMVLEYIRKAQRDLRALGFYQDADELEQYAKQIEQLLNTGV